jgi:endonuclease/exonuclease/phosphatase family metal-dependent hydrolase
MWLVLGNQKKKRKKNLLLLPNTIYFQRRNNSNGTSGERLAIFYSKSRFEEKENGFFFLSETPQRASKGWDALYNRICVWVKLYDKNTKHSFYVFNTHFDHAGQIAKEKSSQLILSKIKEIADNENIICCGDLNSSPLDTLVYNILESELSDSKSIARKNLSTSDGTFNGWDSETSAFPENLRIDYIYCKNFDVFTYNVLTTKSDSGFYPSDHLPVMITCRINEK